MYRLIALHTLRKNLYDHRLMVLFAATLVIFGLAGVISARDLEESATYHESLQQSAFRQSDLEAAIVPRPANELSFIHSDIDRELPSYLVVSPGLVDYPNENVEVRQLSPVTDSLDWTFVLTYVVSIVCLILAFDLVSGEAERGTLRLLLVTGASRKQYFFGSFLGVLLTLMPLVFLGTLLNLVFVLVLAPVDLEAQDWGRVVSMILASMALVIVFSGLGLLASALSRSSGSSLLGALVLWVLAVFVIPNLGLLVAQQVKPTPTISEVEADFRQARERFFAQSYPLSSMDIRQISGRKDLAQAEKEERIAALQRTIDEQNAFALESYRRRVIEIREGYLRSLFSQVQLATVLSRFSPTSAYREVAAAFTGSGLAGQRSFARQARAYMMTFGDYAQEMRENVGDQATTQEVVIEDEGFSIRNVQGISYASVDFDRRGYPRFTGTTISWGEALQQAFPALLVLLLASCGALWAAWHLFSRYSTL